MSLVVDEPVGSTSSRVLVVDDDPQVVMALCAVLRRGGFRAIGAESAEAALVLARDRSFDVAVCDRQLAGVDGIELLQQLREIQPMCQRVLLTGGLDLSTAINAVNRGAVTSVLEKPTRDEALVAVVAEAIDGRRKMVEAYQTLQEQSLGVERSMVRDVLASSHLQLAVQPIVHAAGGAVFGQEGLLRSTHPQLAGPLDVLAAVERHQLIGELADVVVDRALGWLDATPGNQVLFMNLHPGELADPEALGDRLQRLSRHSGRVILEITERSSIYGVSAWEQSLEVIRGLGLDIAVDDLGAGYSALAILAELKPHYIKLDMSIVRDSDRLSHKQRLIDLLCRFADATDALLVAEGIETEAEAATVRECGAHLLQGFLIGRPRLPTSLRVVESARPDTGDRDVG